jgi:uncharacterized protein YcbK (DUF882 family)
MSLWESFLRVLNVKNRTLSFSMSIPITWTGYQKMSNYRYFTLEELAGLDKELCAMLDLARGKAGIPFVISCGTRTPEQNACLAESVKDSAHLTGNAVDLACDDSVSRFAMVKALLDVGFTRIGIYSAHIHADNSKTLPQNVCWYVAGT